jgi:hypothetical protein
VDIVRVVMRDGAMYFGLMALANLANLLTFYLLDVRKSAISFDRQRADDVDFFAAALEGLPVQFCIRGLRHIAFTSHSQPS